MGSIRAGVANDSLSMFGWTSTLNSLVDYIVEEIQQPAKALLGKKGEMLSTSRSDFAAWICFQAILQHSCLLLEDHTAK